MISKRHLGMVLLILGLGGDALILIAGRLGAGAWSGIGPVELTALVAGLLVALAGVPLVLWGGDRPAMETTPLPPGVQSALPTPRDTLERALRIAGLVLAAFALVAFLAYVAVYVTYAVDLFRWPYDYDQGEGFELYAAILFARGEWPYLDNAAYPFYSSNYMPFFHWLMIPLFPIFGQTLLAGRVLSFIATLVNAAAIAWAVRRRVGGRYIPLMSGLGFLASNFVYHVGPLSRQHMTMVLFETLAVLCIAGAGALETRKGWRNALIGLALLLIAAYTKQLAIFTALAIFTYLFLCHPKRAIMLGLGFAAVFLLSFGAINLITNGHWWTNIIAANVNAYDMQQLIALTRSWFKIHTVILLLATGYVAYEVYFAKISVYSLWFAFAIGTGLMSGKWGAGEAYWNTSVAAALILMGFALGKLRLWAAEQPPRRALALAALVPLLLMWQSTRMLHLPTDGPVWGPVARALGVQGLSSYANYPYYDAVGYTQVGHLMSPADYEAGERIMAYVRAAEGPVFSEEAMFTLLAGKPVVTNPTQLLNLYNNGLLDTTEIEGVLREQAFDLVIMRAQFYPWPVLATIGQHYGIVEHIPMNGFNYIIMQPLRE